MLLHRFDRPAGSPPPPRLGEIEALASSLEATLAPREGHDLPAASPVKTALDRFRSQQRLQVALIRRLARDAEGTEEWEGRQLLLEKARRLADRAWALERRARRLFDRSARRDA